MMGINLRQLRVAAAACVAMTLAACSRESAPPASNAAPTPSPSAAASAPGGPRLHVSDETGGVIVVIDPVTAQVVERISVGKRPRGLKVARDGKTLYVALSGSPIAGPGVDESKLPPADRAADGIGVVDLATRKLVRTLPSGQDPESFDLSLDGKTLYVSNEETAEMSVLDLSTGSITTRVKIGGEPEGVTVRPDGREVYVTCEEDNEVYAVDTTTMKVVGRMKTAARPRSIVFTRDGGTAFVTDENAATVTILNPAKHAAAGAIVIPKGANSKTPPRPMGAVVTPDGTQVLVSLGRAKAVAVIDAASKMFVRTIDNVGDRPWGIDVSSDGTKVFTANGPSGDVSMIDLASGTVEKRVATGGSPWAVVYTKGP
jgi:YVTN family beta-propeller protein